jgi:tetratricopeptide (TPR) repeat protein
MSSWRAEDLVELTEQTFDDPGEAIAMLEAAIAAEPNLLCWPLAQDRTVVRGTLLICLGDSYFEAKEREKALSVYEDALKTLRRESDPEVWARAQYNLGRVYGTRLCGDRADNVERELEAYAAVLTAISPDALPAQWGSTQTLVALGYLGRVRGDRAENVERAIGASESALDLIAPSDFPVEWASAHNALGRAYEERVRGNRADNIERAIAAYEAALTVRTRKAYPDVWATTQISLAGTYSDRLRGNKADTVERAIALCEAVLEVITREDPTTWAVAQATLGMAYAERASGEEAENRERAIALCEAALTVCSRESTPKAWATTQLALASAYSSRLHGDKVANVERAIAHYEAALTFYTHKGFPTEHAGLLVGLANTYQRRIIGPKNENRDRAIALYKEALQVQTREAFPRDHLFTNKNLGWVLLRKGEWANASAALNAACESFDLVFGHDLDEIEASLLIREIGPLFAEAAYAAAELGDAEQAFDVLCRGKARLMQAELRVRTLDVDPAQRERVESLRLQIRRQSRLMGGELRTGDQRGQVLDRLRRLRAGLAKLITQSEAGLVEGDALALAGSLVADGCAVVAPIVTDGVASSFLSRRRRTSLSSRVWACRAWTWESVYRLLVGDGKADRAGWLGPFLDWPESDTHLERVEMIGAQLWSLFLSPLKAALEDLGVERHSRLIFLPSPMLGLLPLGLARDPSDDTCLLETYEIAYAPSLTALAKARHEVERPISPSLAAIVNPTGVGCVLLPRFSAATDSARRFR